MSLKGIIENKEIFQEVEFKLYCFITFLLQYDFTMSRQTDFQ